MRIRVLLLVSSMLLLASCRFSVNAPPPALPPVTAGTPAQQRQAVEAGVAIVQGLDRGDFVAAWNDGSMMLKQAVGQDAFIALLANSRARLGKARSRPAPRIGFTSQVDPGGPIGEYAVFAVDSDFAGTVVTEKVVMIHEAGKWKLAGYWMNTGVTLGKKE
jgi:hypothetical protein